jgi:hypothetical protein
MVISSLNKCLQKIIAFIGKNIALQQFYHGLQTLFGFIHQANDGLPFILFVAAYGKGVSRPGN